MSPMFTINFRREAFQRERAKARRRAALLGVWLAYFGALGVVLGLYGLNCDSLRTRTRMMERQVAFLRIGQQEGHDWRPTSTDVAEVEARVTDARRWSGLLARLPGVLPAQARLLSLQYNPEQASGAGERKFVITGEYRVPSGHDRTTSVMAFVNALARDSVFAANYPNVRLVTSRAAESGDGAEFVIECR